MRKLTTLFIASTLALTPITAVFAADTTAPSAETSAAAPAPEAGNMPMKMKHHKGPGRGGPFANLNLTEQQRQQMREIMKELPRERGPATKNEHQALRDIIASDSFDEAKAKEQIDVISKAQSERMLERAKAENKMYNLLTPDQKKKYNENYYKHEQKMMEHMKKKSDQQPTA